VGVARSGARQEQYSKPAEVAMNEKQGRDHRHERRRRREPTEDDRIDKAAAVLAELDQLRAEYADMTADERAALPESVRSFFEGSGEQTDS
jgi:hypothetical protein